LIQAVEEDPSLIFEYKKLKMNLESFKRDKAALKEDCLGFIPNPWEFLLPLKSDKCRHFWVYSPQPNMGKTTWLKDLSSKYRCSWYNYQETFQSIQKDT
uniref:hypothetical protein n=1 Tax=Rheinheimera sp. TaxID=1869214 RepID=UPI0040473E36